MIHELNTKLNAVRKKKGIEIDAKEEVVYYSHDCVILYCDLNLRLRNWIKILPKRTFAIYSQTQY